MPLIIKSLQNKHGIRRYIGPKRILLFFLFVAFVLFSWNCYQTGLLTPAIIKQYRDIYPVGTVLVFILIYALTVIAAIPSAPLNLAAGYFWGGLLGGIYTALAVTIGGWVSFAASRLLIGQPLAKRFDHKWLNIVQAQFEQSGWKFVAFARINPIIPTGPLNYLLGLTSLSHKDFVWVTFVFLLPPAIAGAYVGDVLQTITDKQSDAATILKDVLITSAVLTVLVGIKYVFRFINSVKRND